MAIATGQPISELLNAPISIIRAMYAILKEQNRKADR